MTVLLEMKERLKLMYSKGDVFIVPIVKFLLAFITFNTLNGRMGYMALLDDMRIVLIAALACSFLPLGVIVLLGAVFSLMHMYALSLEVALVGLCVYLIMYLLFFRFSPKDSLVVVLTPLLCALKIPYVIPIAVGLVCAPASAVSVGCGVAVYYLFQLVTDSAPNIRTMGEEAALDKVRMLVESFLANKAMLVIIAAFAITVVVVYMIRRMSVNYAWTIAMIAGAMVNIVVLLIGDLYYDINLSVGSVLLGSLLAIVVAKVIEFFRFCVDYSRTEKVQFEDDEYYYYVKAVPKMAVSMQTRTVKKINSQRVREPENGMEEDGSHPAGRVRPGGRTVTTERSSAGGASRQGGRTAAADRSPTGGANRQGSRQVTTERAAAGGNGSQGGRHAVTQRSVPGGNGYQSSRNAAAERTAPGRNNAGNTGRTQGRSVTIGRTADIQDGYDEDEWP